jgi:hypothetical protein
MPVRYPLPNKESIFAKIKECTVFFKFDLKLGFWQIGINQKDRFKTSFVVPHGQFQWKVMPFGLKNAQSEFQKRMEDVFEDLLFLVIYNIYR